MCLWICIGCRTQSHIKTNFNDKKELVNFLESISYFWKNDSMANNGYRDLVVRQLVKYNFNAFNKDSLIEYLGAPSRKSTLSGFENETYDYFFINPKFLSRTTRYVPPNEAIGTLIFQIQSDKVEYCVIGHIDITF